MEPELLDEPADRFLGRFLAFVGLRCGRFRRLGCLRLLRRSRPECGGTMESPNRVLVTPIVFMVDLLQIASPRTFATPGSLYVVPVECGQLARLNYLAAGRPQVSVKNPAVTMPPGARDDTGTSTSTTAKSGSLGTCRALFR